MKIPLQLTFVVLLMCLTASAQSTRPTLELLDRGMQELYQDVQGSLVRVVVPLQLSPRLTDNQHPLQKWNQSVRVFVERPLSTTTQPLEVGRAPATQMPMSLPTQVIRAEFLGLVLDDRGNVLLPLAVDAQLVGDRLLRVTFNDQQVTTAQLVGSDTKTNIAVIHLAQPLGKPVKMASETPALGSLVVLMSPIRRLTRMALWTGGQEEHAVVINSGGAVAGFVRYGHMLEPYAFRPVVEQLVTTGTVKRAVLGVMIRELDPDSRSQVPALGDRPAARVEAIDQGSAAEAAGLKIGDLIISLAGDPVNDPPHFAAALTNKTGKTELKIMREGTEQALTVDLTPRAPAPQ